MGRLESRENCQVGVFLSYVTAKGHSLIDRELSLPFDWIADRKRSQEAGIPGSARFQTKPELARPLLERLRQAHLPISWVVADTALRRQPGSAHLARGAWLSLCAGRGLR